MIVLLAKELQNEKKGEVVWRKDKKNVNRPAESEIMLGYMIGIVYQRVRHVHISTHIFGS